MTAKGWEPEGALRVGPLPEDAVGQFRRAFGIPETALDPAFGVIRITLPPAPAVHTFMAVPEEAERLMTAFPGVFSAWDNPGIAPRGQRPGGPRPF